ncbi:MAG: prepilin-type N-terminal cleavage/methylation domain-containing protein [Planctomycetes bacterium]|nr:prepilin-type N-terminal cleavage/methylation domain-containing protein [Planctomycetota bacterium]
MKTSPNRSFTLIETMVTLAIFSTLLVGIASLTIDLQASNARAITSTDLSAEGTRVMRQLRRELRQSGWQDAGTDRIGTPATPIAAPVVAQQSTAGAVTILSFQRRVALGSATPANDWGNQISYQVVPDGVFVGVAGTPAKFQLLRTEGAITTVVATNLSAMSVQRNPGEDTVLVQIEFQRREPSSAAGANADGIRRRFRERIRLGNTQPD